MFNPLRGSDQSGTVAIYDRRASGWVLRRFVKAVTNNALYSFGKTTGIDGDREDASVSGRGAVWLY